MHFVPHIGHFAHSGASAAANSSSAAATAAAQDAAAASDASAAAAQQQVQAQQQAQQPKTSAEWVEALVQTMSQAKDLPDARARAAAALQAFEQAAVSAAQVCTPVAPAFRLILHCCRQLAIATSECARATGSSKIYAVQKLEQLPSVTALHDLCNHLMRRRSRRRRRPSCSATMRSSNARWPSRMGGCRSWQGARRSSHSCAQSPRWASLLCSHRSPEISQMTDGRVHRAT